MRVVEYDDMEWKGEQLVLLRKGKEVEIIFLDDLVKDWMREMKEKGIVEYKEVVE
jgi:hypothetical protein